jgi:hypothetical protein
LDRQRSVATLIGIAAVALALVPAACGGGGGKDDSDGVASLGGDSQQSANDSAQADMDPEDAMLAFARCMREHGVNIPDPSRSGGGFRFRSGARGPDPSSAKFREAERACQRFLEQAKPLNLSEEDRAAMQDAALEYAKCMREHGVDMADPDTSGPGIKMQLPKGVGPDNPRFEAAQKACQSIMEDARRKAGLGEGRLERRGPGSGS